MKKEMLILFCKYCGNEMKDTAMFCPKCGAKVSNMPKQNLISEPVATEQQPVVQKKKSKKLAWIIPSAILAFLLILVGIAALLVFPLKMDLQTLGNTVTYTGSFTEISVNVDTNQPIRSVKYALNPEEPSNTQVYTPATHTGSATQKVVSVPNLQVQPGENTLYIAIETWFTVEIKEIKLVCNVGYTSPPTDGAVEEIYENYSILTDELLVVFKDTVDQSTAFSVIESVEGQVVGQVFFANQYQVRFDFKNISQLNQKMSLLSAKEEVASVCYNTVYLDLLSATPNDEKYEKWDVTKPDGNNWHLETIDAPGAWEYQSQMSVAKSGVVDTFLDYDHPDLQVNSDKLLWMQTDDFSTMADMHTYFEDTSAQHVCETPKNPKDKCKYCGAMNHGTHVTGLVGAKANNTAGVSGTSWNANMYFGSPFYYTKRDNAQLTQLATDQSILYNIAYQVMQGCRTVNISLGSNGIPTNEAGIEKLEQSAALYETYIDQLSSNGFDFLIIKSAGNDKHSAANCQLNRMLTTGEHARAHTVIVGAVSKKYSKKFLSKELQYSPAKFTNFGGLVDVFAPGEGVYSTIFNNYGNMDGTSMATPIVSGVANILYSAKPDLRYDQVKQALIKEVSHYCAVKENMYPIVNAKLALESVINGKSSAGVVKKPTVGFISGSVQDAVTEKVLKNADVSITDNKTKEKIAVVVENGIYYAYAKPGTYTMVFSATGYVTETLYSVKVTAKAVTYNARLNMVEKKEKAGQISGRIIDAFDASSISKATIKIFKGVNNTKGDPVKTLKSNSNGGYSVKLAPGNYTLLATKSGYTKGTATVICVSGKKRGNQDCTLTPKLNDGEFRVILTWGEYPRDLDSHLVGPAPGGGRFHTAFYGKDHRSGGTLYANLDVDDTTSYGPETTSVYKKVNGTYTFYVHDYTNRGSYQSTGIANSGVQIKVYISGRTEPYVFNPPNEDGTLWEVFSVKNGKLKAINQMSYHSNPQTIGG